jgi:hypothetical protein
VEAQNVFSPDQNVDCQTKQSCCRNLKVIYCIKNQNIVYVFILADMSQVFIYFNIY